MIWDQNLQWPETTLIERNLVPREAAECIQHGSVNDGLRRVQVPPVLGTGARKINYGLAFFSVHRYGHANFAATVHFVLKATILQCLQNPANRLFSIVLNVTHVGMDGIGTIMFDHETEFIGSFFTRCQLSLEVRNIHLRIA